MAATVGARRCPGARVGQNEREKRRRNFAAAAGVALSARLCGFISIYGVLR